ncbi:PEP-CTERM sorting domain-containing protein [Anaerohalosphaera lusitana]|uniref:PEP-CTERM sorting domain-containing protein n=1 Tax=Anaerohalosphaera lusitana TaxID=1936003 RepID=UPI00147528AC|nr:PEP-CTERM sorting domain-containing protein [Anaerohalosphaera lusitana]
MKGFGVIKYHILLLFVFCGSSLAQLTRYVDKAQFVDAVPPIVATESFEDLATDASSAQRNTIELAQVTISTLDTSLSVHNTPEYGQQPTDGSQYVRISGGDEPGGREITFDFITPVNWFGLNIIDWGDGTVNGSGELVARVDCTEYIDITQGTKPDGNVTFFGFSSNNPFDCITIYNDIPTDSWAIDELYFATPEPATAVIFAAGTLMLARRRKK